MQQSMNQSLHHTEMKFTLRLVLPGSCCSCITRVTHQHQEITLDFLPRACLEHLSRAHMRSGSTFRAVCLRAGLTECLVKNLRSKTLPQINRNKVQKNWKTLKNSDNPQMPSSLFQQNSPFSIISISLLHPLKNHFDWKLHVNTASTAALQKSCCRLPFTQFPSEHAHFNFN